MKTKIFTFACMLLAVMLVSCSNDKDILGTESDLTSLGMHGKSGKGISDLAPNDTCPFGNISGNCDTCTVCVNGTRPGTCVNYTGCQNGTKPGCGICAVCVNGSKPAACDTCTICVNGVKPGTCTNHAGCPNGIQPGTSGKNKGKGNKGHHGWK